MMDRRAVLLLPLLAACPALAQQQSPADFVRALYAAHLPSLLPGNRSGGVMRHNVRPRWFAPELASRMGQMNYDPLANGNDPDVQNLRVTDVSATVAEAAFTAYGDAMLLRYDLTRGPGGFRVRDIRYPDGRTLRRDLRMPG